MKTLLDFLVFDEDIEWRSFCDEKDELLALIEQKADFSVKNKDGETILHYIARIGRNEDESKDDLLRILKYSLECGCKFSDQDNNGLTAIHHEGYEWQCLLYNHAIEAGNVDVFNIQDNNGNTPLHVYCMTCHSNEWVRAVKHGADPYVKNKKGLMPHELIATANNPASAKKQFMKTVEKVLSQQPNPKTQADDGYLIKPAWETPVKASDKLNIIGTQLFDTDDDSGYSSFFGVNDKFAILNTYDFRMIVDLQKGAVKNRSKRYSGNLNEKNCSHNGVWYSVEDNGSNEYIIAIDPEKGIDPTSGTSLWQTNIGSIEMYIRTDLHVDGNLLALNTSSALIVLDINTGKVLWLGKPKGRTEKTMPIIYNDLIYTQLLVRKKPILYAFDAQTGTPVDKKHIELAHPMFESGWRKNPRRELVYNNRLYYLTQNEKYEVYFVVVDLATGEELFSQSLQFGSPYDRPFRFDHSGYSMDVDGDRVHIFINTSLWAGTFNIDTCELIVDAPYDFYRKYHYDIVKITRDELYVKYSGEDYASFEIYSRANQTLLQQVKLPERPKLGWNGVETVICNSGIIYTYRRLFAKGKKDIGELCMIG